MAAPASDALPVVRGTVDGILRLLHRFDGDPDSQAKIAVARLSDLKQYLDNVPSRERV